MSLIKVNSGMVVRHVDLTSGTQLDVYQGGLAKFTTISDTALNLFGGSAVDTSVLSGGRANVLSGGQTRDDVVASGGVEQIESGGSSQDLTIEKDGEEDLTLGAAAHTIVDSGGLLFLYDYESPSLITDTQVKLGGKIDLRFLRYVSGATSAQLNSATDQLTVTAGGSSYTMQLAGHYNDGQFVALDENGGTAARFDRDPASANGPGSSDVRFLASGITNGLDDLTSAAGTLSELGMSAALAVGPSVSSEYVAAAASQASIWSFGSLQESEEVTVAHGGHAEAVPFQP